MANDMLTPETRIAGRLKRWNLNNCPVCKDPMRHLDYGGAKRHCPSCQLYFEKLNEDHIMQGPMGDIT